MPEPGWVESALQEVYEALCEISLRLHVDPADLLDAVVKEELYPNHPRCTVCGKRMRHWPRMQEPVCKTCETNYARRHDDTIIAMWMEEKRSTEISAALNGELTPQQIVSRVGNIRRSQGIPLELRK